MKGLGTLINTVAVIVAGIIGHFAGKLVKDSFRESMQKACGISVLFLGVAGALQGLLSIEGTSLIGTNSMFVVLCLVIGTALGEIVNIEGGFEHFGEWLKQKTGNSGDKLFVDAFVTTSFTVCIGAMTIVGSIQDGVSGDYTTLAVKSVLDFVIVIVMTSTMGKGCAFSAIPVFVLEGLITLLGSVIAPYLTELAIANINMVGSVLIFCVGVNLVWGKTIRVANMLPGVIISIIAAYL